MSSTCQIYGVYMSDVATMNMQKMKSYMVHTHTHTNIYMYLGLFMCSSKKTIEMNMELEPTEMQASPRKLFFPPNQLVVERISFFFPPKL